MRFSFSNLQAFEDWRYNLCLVAPGKGEAKKTVSEGFIRVEVSLWPRFDSYPLFQLEGTATDDILSITTAISGVSSDKPKRHAAWIKPADLKLVEVVQENIDSYSVDLPEDPAYSEEFDKIFWEEHVLDSIYGESKGIREEYWSLNPDRFGKLGLLRPRGLPFEYQHVEWADQNILRWFQGDTDTRGVHTYGKR